MNPDETGIWGSGTGSIRGEREKVNRIRLTSRRIRPPNLDFLRCGFLRDLGYAFGLCRSKQVSLFAVSAGVQWLGCSLISLACGTGKPLLCQMAEGFLPEQD